MSYYSSSVPLPFKTVDGFAVVDKTVEKMVAPPRVKHHLTFYTWRVDICHIQREGSTVPFDTYPVKRYKIIGIFDGIQKGLQLETSYIDRANSKVAATQSGSFYTLGECLDGVEFANLAK